MNSEDVLAFWFDGEPDRVRDEWFKQDDAFDERIRARFGFTVQSAVDGALDGWAMSPRGALALVIVLDQFSRNLHRGSHLAFAGDAHARRIARSAVVGGSDALVSQVQRVFFYMPFEHSEDIADQEFSVALFSALPEDGPAGIYRKYAVEHREVIRRFGRFPFRKTALGRDSTPAEIAYMAAAGRSS